ncbi:hypothetical protein ABS71_06660 [bacterium SCN 62-11]|nr:FkbM family methyltransferase [Candidatus Eremiobacteraeota bacterium]ODT73745.1 MAG: hypothetical protein ABS71_06660 [bacterium SCN 62-11]
MIRTALKLANVVARGYLGSPIRPSPLLARYVAALGCLRRGDCALDIGANIGFFAGLLAEAVGPQGRVLAFEPNPIPLKVLRASVRRSRLSQVKVFAQAVSDHAQELKLQTGWFDFGENATVSSHLKTAERLGFFRRNLSIQAVRLDDFLKDDGLMVDGEKLPAPKFLKIDTEGHELSVLTGAEKLLEKHAPTMVIEYGYDPRQPGHRYSYPAWLRARGYQLLDFHGFVDFTPEFEAAIQHSYLTDLLAIPPGLQNSSYLTTIRGLGEFGLDRVES